MTEAQTFTTPGPLNTAVLFLVFNRPDVTAQVFEAIRQAEPARLYVAADGPRANKPGEAERCAEVRRIAAAVDWTCEVKTLFREENLGCKRAVSSAIDWFFANEEEGIVLEDDCLPHPSFFSFCVEMLDRYRHDQRIGQITGDNFQFGYRLNDDSYYFSRNSHIWGWASWRDRWQADYDVDLKTWPKIKEEGRVYDLFYSAADRKKWTEIFEKVYSGKIDTWDYQLCYALLCSSRLTIIPNINLISNIGFGPGATHTINYEKNANLPVESISFPLKHPSLVMACRSLDDRYAKYIQSEALSMKEKLFRKVKRMRNSIDQLVP